MERTKNIPHWSKTVIGLAVVFTLIVCSCGSNFRPYLISPNIQSCTTCFTSSRSGSKRRKAVKFVPPYLKSSKFTICRSCSHVIRKMTFLRYQRSLPDWLWGSYDKPSSCPLEQPVSKWPGSFHWSNLARCGFPQPFSPLSAGPWKAKIWNNPLKEKYDVFTTCNLHLGGVVSRQFSRQTGWVIWVAPVTWPGPDCLRTESCKISIRIVQSIAHRPEMTK